MHQVQKMRLTIGLSHRRTLTGKWLLEKRKNDNNHMLSFLAWLISNPSWEVQYI